MWALETNEELFSKFEFIFEIFAEIWKFRRKLETNSGTSLSLKMHVVIYHWNLLVELYKLMKSFFSKFDFVFEIFGEIRKFRQKFKNLNYNSKCVLWYIIEFVSPSSTKKWRVFFRNSNSFSKYSAKFGNFGKNSKILIITQNACCYTSLDLSRRALQSNEEFFWNSNCFFEIFGKIQICFLT